MAHLFCILFDVLDGISDSLNGLSLVIRNGDTEFLLELHDELYGVQGISTQIVCEACLGLYFRLINTKFVNDNVL